MSDEKQLDLFPAIPEQPAHSGDYDTLQKEHLEVVEALGIAIADAKAFINQVDREGVGMKSVTDHRKRVEKFFKHLEKIGRT